MLGAGKGLRHHLPGIHLGILSGQLQILEISVIFSGTLSSSHDAHAMAVAGYVAMHNTYSNDKKYMLVVWDGWFNQLRFLPYDTTIYISHEGTYCGE